MSLIEKIAAGLGILAGAYLIFTNPHGFSVATNSISGAVVAIDKTAQGR